MGPQGPKGDQGDQGAGGISGSIVDTQIAFGVGTAIGGSNDLTWDNTVKALTVGPPGASIPGVASINLQSDGTQDLDLILTSGGGSSADNNIVLRRSSGTLASPTITANGSGLGSHVFLGLNGTGWTYGAKIYVYTTDDPGTFVPTEVSMVIAGTSNIGEWLYNGTTKLSTFPGSIKQLGSTSGSITHAVPAVVTPYTIQWPSAPGTANQIMRVASVAGTVLTMEWHTP